jgi:hypothetical protein
MGIYCSKFFFTDFEEEGRKGTMQPGSEDTSILVQIEEVKCGIRKLSFVTVLSPVREVKRKG